VTTSGAAPDDWRLVYVESYPHEYTLQHHRNRQGSLFRAVVTGTGAFASEGGRPAVTEGTDNPSGQTTQTRHYNLYRHDSPFGSIIRARRACRSLPLAGQEVRMLAALSHPIPAVLGQDFGPLEKASHRYASRHARFRRPGPSRFAT
jgi:hypothetical protein